MTTTCLPPLVKGTPLPPVTAPVCAPSAGRDHVNNFLSPYQTSYNRDYPLKKPIESKAVRSVRYYNVRHVLLFHKRSFLQIATLFERIFQTFSIYAMPFYKPNHQAKLKIFIISPPATQVNLVWGGR